jgi:hypothetical protein
VTDGPGVSAAHDGSDTDGPVDDRSTFRFDRQLVLEQLGGWRGMLDASLPTVAFIVGNSVGGLTPGIWSAVGAAVLVFALRLVRRQSVQQAVSGLFAVVVDVAIAAYSGHARDYFVLGILRNAAIAVVLLGSALVRRPLVGVVAEFLAPSHLGGMAGGSPLPFLRGRGAAPVAASRPERGADPAPERHWREDRRMLRAYTWLTLLWTAMFAARVLVQGPLYQADAVGWLGTTSMLLGLPLFGAVLVVTLWVVARLHRHRSPQPETQPGAEDHPAA